MNFTYESIYNIIRDFRGANKSKYNNKYFDNPSKYYFKLFFYFNQGGLLDSRKMTDTSTDVDYVDNAITYLDRNMEWNRCELLELFIKLLQEINTNTPWYFAEVEGLSDEELEAKFEDEFENADEGVVTEEDNIDPSVSDEDEGENAAEEVENALNIIRARLKESMTAPVE